MDIVSNAVRLGGRPCCGARRRGAPGDDSVRVSTGRPRVALAVASAGVLLRTLTLLIRLCLRPGHVRLRLVLRALSLVRRLVLLGLPFPLEALVADRAARDLLGLPLDVLDHTLDRVHRS